MAQLGKAEGNSPQHVGFWIRRKPTEREYINRRFHGDTGDSGVGLYLLVETRGIWVGGVSGMGKTERSGNLLVMERREKKKDELNSNVM